MPLLFLLFIAMPIIEVVVLIMVGQQIGVLWTIGLIVLTAFIGINMLRVQGVATLNRANWRIQSGEVPAKEMVEGIFLAVGGALLLTPGFVTDFIGFMFLLPFTRRALAKVFKARIASASTQGPSYGYQRRHSPSDDKDNHAGNVIEGEVVREETAPPKNQ